MQLRGAVADAVALVAGERARKARRDARTRGARRRRVAFGTVPTSAPVYGLSTSIAALPWRRASPAMRSASCARRRLPQRAAAHRGMVQHQVEGVEVAPAPVRRRCRRCGGWRSAARAARRCRRASAAARRGRKVVLGRGRAEHDRSASDTTTSRRCGPAAVRSARPPRRACSTSSMPRSAAMRAAIARRIDARRAGRRSRTSRARRGARRTGR